MTSNTEKKPAVRSLEIEQATQEQQDNKSNIDKGLEGTFPASDPVSHTASSIPEGRANVGQAERLQAVEPDKRRIVGSPNYASGLQWWIRQHPLTAMALTAALTWIWSASR